jgi:hypothetical protein
MLEDDIFRLNAREQVSLGNLEWEIWRRERQFLARCAQSRRLASWQGFVLILAVMASAATGVAVAGRFSAPSSFVSEEGLAPSNLLLRSR